MKKMQLKISLFYINYFFHFDDKKKWVNSNELMNFLQTIYTFKIIEELFKKYS